MVDKTMSSISPKSGSLSVGVRSFKSVVTKDAHKIDSIFSWQPGYYDTIICTTGQLARNRKYKKMECKSLNFYRIRTSVTTSLEDLKQKTFFWKGLIYAVDFIELHKSVFVLHLL
jgi:hypothetical protein